MLSKQYLIDNKVELNYDNTIFFFKPDKKYGFLSQWHQSTFSFCGVDYTCAEQCMMFHKALLFNDTWSGLLISNPYKSPSMYKQLGRNVKNFDEDIWNENKLKIVLMTNIAKFTYNKDLAKLLLDTEDKYLIEASPYDTVWGIGRSINDPKRFNPELWKGENLLGFTLMRVRDGLKKLDNKNIITNEVPTE